MSRPKPNGKRKPYKIVEFKRYAYFISRTREERDQEFGYHTDQGFAKQFKMQPAALSDWKLREDFWKEHDKHMARFKGAEADVISGVVRRAANGEKIGAQDAQLYLRYVKGWNPAIRLTDAEFTGGNDDFG